MRRAVTLYGVAASALAALVVAPPAAAHSGGGGEGWSVEALPLSFALLSVALVVAGMVRLRRRGRADLARPWRLGVFVLAVVLACLVLFSPLDAIAEGELLSAHMLQHVVLGDLAPALALVALRGPLLFFALPSAGLRVFSRTVWLRRLLAFLVLPATSYLVWLAALVVWHLPPAYELAIRNPLAHEIEHVSFVVAGLLIWAQLIDPARRQVLTTNGRLLFLLLVFAGGQGLAITLVAQPDPVYGIYDHGHDGRLGLSPSADQDFAGLVMMAEQLLTLGVCAAFVIREHLRGAGPSPDGPRHPLAL